MLKRIRLGTAAVIGLVLVSGCATTGRNYQSDIDSLNSRITSLQAQLSKKDQAISKLQSQVGDQESALTRAESEKRELSDKLNSAMTQLDSASRKPVVKPEESDLK